MKHDVSIPMVMTIKERCRVCFTCVRECPAKAIRIADGQAEVLTERCIGCGNCVRVCSQGAKVVPDWIPAADELLAQGLPVAAIIAPSFPAEFDGIDYHVLIGMIRKLGFASVHEVAFGADLVAKAYHDLLPKTNGQRYIATTCPAVVAYVERYHPELVGHLAPIVSPMVAMARVLRSMRTAPMRIVFIGPCVAKKGEASSQHVPNEIDAVLTFTELRTMFAQHEITADTVDSSDFDPPLAGEGALFAISRGLLQAAKIDEDLLVGDVVAADGRTNFVEAIREFGAGDLDAKLLEVLACNGCIMGPGIATKAPLFSRRRRVQHFVRRRMAAFDGQQWQEAMNTVADLDMARGFSASDQRIPVPDKQAIMTILERMGKFKPEDELNCGACGYDTCVEHALAIYKGLAESEMCLPYTIDQLRTTVEKLSSTQDALMQSEKLASMGQLAAGIAHEVNNPLGVVLMYAHLLLDECDADAPQRDDLKMIAEQADRCKKIVAGLLDFARENKVRRQRTDMRHIVSRAIKATTTPRAVTVTVEHDMDDPYAQIDPDQIVQVLTNLTSNAIGAMPDGGTLAIRTTGTDNDIRITVADTGTGIARENMHKIFEPFFTTKPIGKGTGLGLAVTYGIVKMHCGDITVESNAAPTDGPTGTTFTVTLPRIGRTSTMTA